MMLLVIMGVVVGIIFGSAFLGYQGWVLGPILGALAGTALQQLQKIRRLELSINDLLETQLKINHQLTTLKNDLLNVSVADPKKPSVSDAAVDIQPAVKIAASASAQSTPSTDVERVELELPDLQASSVQEIPRVQAAAVAATTRPKPTRPIMPAATKSEPTPADKLVAALHRFFTEGNPIVRIGMVVMFLGVSFLVKYASSQGLLPIEFRLTGVVLGATALLIAGWKTRERHGAYGLVLQGGGIAIIYLTLFAAAKLYGLIPLGVGFGLLFLVVMLGVLLALLQNAQVLAILATAGGFLAPILTSSGEGSHVGLFSFYLILNMGILTIALYKAWRMLNWIGFIFTFVITTAWGVLKYEPSFYASTQPFLIAFFALYLIVSILFSFKQPTNLKGMVDGSLVFGLPLIAFGLQTVLLQHTEHGLAISAVILAVIYIALSVVMGRRYLQTHRVLIESFLALGILFATLVIPLALDASWTSVTWALEATGLVWVGLRQARMRPRIVGYLLHIAAAISLLVVHGIETGLTPIITGDFIGLALLALTSLMIAYVLHYFADTLSRGEKILSAIAIGFGVIWWFVAGINEIYAHVHYEYNFSAIILFATLSSLLILLVAKKLLWSALTHSIYTLLPFMIILSMKFYAEDNIVHPLHGFGWLVFTAFIALQYRFLFTQEQSLLRLNFVRKPGHLSVYHVLTAWYLFGLMFWEVSWQRQHFNLHGTAALMIWFAAVVIPAIVLIGAGQKKLWPFITFSRDYKNWIPAPLFALIALWFFVVCHKTLASTEHYVPILNPLDLAQFAILLVFAYAAKRKFMDCVSFISDRVRMGLLGIMVFVWVNVVTIRAMSHYQDISYEVDSLWNAVQIQMALSILWAACALVVMNLARRLQRRELWMIGAALLGLVLFKLFTKDLTGSGTLARIISFLVVGGLMLLIGFLSPIPSRISIDATTDSDEKATAHEQAMTQLQNANLEQKDTNDE